MLCTAHSVHKPASRTDLSNETDVIFAVKGQGKRLKGVVGESIEETEKGRKEQTRLGLKVERNKK